MMLPLFRAPLPPDDPLCCVCELGTRFRSLENLDMAIQKRVDCSAPSDPE